MIFCCLYIEPECGVLEEEENGRILAAGSGGSSVRTAASTPWMVIKPFEFQLLILSAKFIRKDENYVLILLGCDWRNTSGQRPKMVLRWRIDQSENCRHSSTLYYEKVMEELLFSRVHTY